MYKDTQSTRNCQYFIITGGFTLHPYQHKNPCPAVSHFRTMSDTKTHLMNPNPTASQTASQPHQAGIPQLIIFPST